MLDNISTVICVKNGEKTLEKCLKSIIGNSPLEIIIVDGGSKDCTIEIAKKYTDKIFSDEGRGLAYARQLGAEKVKGEYVAYIDADVELPNENVLSLMLKELKENEWIAIHAQLIDPREDKTYWVKGEDFHWRNRCNKPGERRYLDTIVCLIKIDTILRYRFDPFFKGAAEDGDFYHRVGNDDYKFGVSKVVAYHYHRASFKDFVKQRIWYGKGDARAIWKHKAINLLLVPGIVLKDGIFLCTRHQKLLLIPFYFVWAVFLFIGMIEGLCELLYQKFLNIIQRKVIS